MKKILVIQLAKMGDVFQSNPLLSFLKKKYKNSTISFLHSVIFTSAAKLVKADELIDINLDEHIVANKNEFEVLDEDYSHSFAKKLGNFDIAINLNTNNFAAFLLKNVTAEQKYGYGSSNSHSNNWLNYCSSFIKNRKLGSINLCDIWRNITEFNDFKPISRIEENSNLIVLHPGTRNFKRSWPLENWLSLGKILAKNNFNIAITGTEEHISSYFKQNADFAYNDYINKYSLNQSLDLLKTAKVVISCDTGIIHLASLANCPVVAIFTGPAYAYETLSYNTNAEVLFPNNFNCYPCYENESCLINHQCQKSITPAMVIDVVLNDNGSSFYQTTFDEMGQFLLPNLKQKLTASTLLQLVYRSFALKTFFLKELDTKPIFKKYYWDLDFLDDFLKKYNRELLIVNKLLPGFNQNMALPNLQFFAPLFLLKKLGNIQLVNTLHNYLQNFDLKDFVL